MKSQSTLQESRLISSQGPNRRSSFLRPTGLCAAGLWLFAAVASVLSQAAESPGIAPSPREEEYQAEVAVDLTGVGLQTKRVWNETADVNGDWQFLASESGPTLPPADNAPGWHAVTLPHTWNAEDTLKTANYRMGKGWYRRTIAADAALLGKRAFLRFGAANLKAQVFVNGQLAGEHKGGYSAFTIELTKLLKAGHNAIAVRVSNVPEKNLVPATDGLFTLYGGLYRGVQLITAPKVCLERARLGGPGVRVWSEKVSAQSAEVHLCAAVDGVGADGQPLEPSDYSLRATLRDAAGKTVSSADGPPGELVLPTVNKPALWSPESPTLYTLTVELRRGEQTLDMATVCHGFRWYEFTPDRGFFLNGNPYKLRGVNRHQDFYGKGNALGPREQAGDLLLMKKLGVNWLRLAHYQQDDLLLQLCDELGILVWEEIPWVRNTTIEPEFEANAKSQLREMVEQHFNHPCVLLWGLGNEIYFTKGPDGRALQFEMTQRLNDAVHAADPTRKTVIVCGNANYYSDLKIMTIPDVIGYNLYCGWYGGSLESFTTRARQLHEMNPDKPMIVSEFGAGADPWVHANKPVCFDQSQEYQILFLESYLNQMREMPWLAGYNWWNFADFSWARSTNPPLYNNKGLLTFNRRPKDSFHYLRARFGSDPVVYVPSPNWTERRGPAQVTMRAFTNFPEVEFLHNGKSLGIQKSGFTWQLNLTEGDNTVLARGRAKDGTTMRHGYSFHYTPGEETADVIRKTWRTDQEATYPFQPRNGGDTNLPTGETANPFADPDASK
jgi:beta-galactosidase